MFSVDVLDKGEGIMQENAVDDGVDGVIDKFLSSLPDLSPDGLHERIDLFDLSRHVHLFDVVFKTFRKNLIFRIINKLITFATLVVT